MSDVADPSSTNGDLLGTAKLDLEHFQECFPAVVAGYDRREAWKTKRAGSDHVIHAAPSAVIDRRYSGLFFLAVVFLPSVGFAAENQNALNPAADQASRISGLWWLYLAVLGTIWGLVMAAVLRAVFRSRNTPRVEEEIPLLSPPTGRERWMTAGVTSAVAVTAVILLVLLFVDYFTSSAISSPAPPDAMKIKITGHQWWWEVRYQNDDPSKILVTANELHIPTGKPVKFELDSTDVIHSFWVPNLHGKKDLIPGHPTSTWFVATRPGTYFGQCAEFCGPQHAHMRLTITADSPEQFSAWMEAQRKSAPSPSNDQERKGLQIFLGTTCVMCHTIQGTPARATVGPDLTHFASRTWIGAGALPNARGYLGGWILDPQTHKPGVRMPQHTFSGEELNALLDYLGTLK